MRTYLGYGFIGFLFGLIVGWFAWATPAQATQERVCFCHNVNNNPHTICTSNQGKIKGHKKHVKNGTDYKGECRVEPTPTPEVTPTPTPTEKPCDECCKRECEPTVTPTETPEPTPTEVVTITRGFSEAGAPPLPQCEAPTHRPTVTYLGQDGQTFSYEWTEVRDGLHTYWINYGATPDNLNHSIVVDGEEVSITMNGEGSNWIEVAGYDNGCLGPFSLITN